jgi:hypothetical protein
MLACRATIVGPTAHDMPTAAAQANYGAAVRPIPVTSHEPPALYAY